MTFRAGDYILHKPSGEQWVLAADQHRGDVVCAGWPETIARATDCELVEAASDETREDMLRRVAKECTSDTRGSWARCQLDVIEAPAIDRCMAL